MDIIMKENLYSYNSKKRNLTICEELPYDILLYILSYLTPTELCCLSRVCHSFRVLAEDDWIWRGFYPMIRFNFCYHFQLNEFPKILNTQQCKQIYIQELQTIRSVSQFIGTWHEQWCDVQVLNSTKISFNGINFIVEYTKNKFEAEFISFNGQSLKFKLTGGDSGWSFIYTLTLNNNSIHNKSNNNNNQNINNNHHNNNNNSSNGMKIHLDDQNLQQDSLHLHVLRIHDNIEFTGMFSSSKSESNSPPPHFRNKNNYKLYLMKQEIQQLQQISSQTTTSSSNEIFNSNTNNSNSNNNNNNHDDNNNNNNNNSNSSCDSRRHTRIYAY
ncbi:hypothetical protein RB653_005252 [Dictyostelium firmibasis]|uniref:F-box domain-containing protein n=1 Tax=Dictyostelium firmibasis TaxID=79012 RepID=A0AAN7YSU0_9MYCE